MINNGLEQTRQKIINFDRLYIYCKIVPLDSLAPGLNSYHHVMLVLSPNYNMTKYNVLIFCHVNIFNSIIYIKSTLKSN